MIEMAGLSAEELAFMGSPAGEAAIARARRDHDLRTRSQPDALGWSIGHIAAAVRTGYLEQQRQQFAAATAQAGADYRNGELVALRALRNEAAAAGGRNVR